MLASYKLKGISKRNHPGFFRKQLSLLFHRFARSKIALKMKSHGRIIAAIYDFCAVILAWILACSVVISAMKNISIRFLGSAHDLDRVMTSCWGSVLGNLFWVLLPQLVLFRYFGLYRGFWRFASIQDLRKIFYVSVLGGLISWLVLTGILFGKNLQHILLPPYTVALLYSVFLIGFLSSARLCIRFIKNYHYRHPDCQRVVIVGAGNAGEGLVRDLLRDSSHRYKPVAFVDDNLLKLGREIHGIIVVGAMSELPYLIEKYDIDLVLIAIPSASSASMRSVVEVCEKANVRCYTLPGIKDLANGRVSINILRSVLLEDLLGRYPVTCQWDFIKTHLQDKTILITGAGGSIGSELCRQIASLGVIERLIILDNNEYNLYSIDMELRQQFPSHQIESILLSITDRIGIQSIFKKYRPHLVFHAAAYKHVPLLEYQSRVAIYNNIIGTCVLAEEAVKCGVDKFVLISSDKAVNPTNIMGATKRAAEYFCQNLQDEVEHTQFLTVRFGNVVDSAGSVIPLFRKQIEAGGPVTVTHPDITRFFMTIHEASQLILQAAFLGSGGEIFVLDMGDPIKIRYLAEQMIKLADKVVDRDIKIIYTGLRPGEKLYEECFYLSEKLQQTDHTKILRAQSKRRNFIEIKNTCYQIEKACQSSEDMEETLVALLKKLVPEYQVSVENVPRVFQNAVVNTV